jgi:Enoyl-(Acyl carrier protein) reductase
MTLAPTKTAIVTGASRGKSKEQIDHFVKLAPLERLGSPEDIANVVAFLVGPGGGWVNGQVLCAQLERGFEVAVVKDPRAAPRHHKLGDGFEAAVMLRFFANGVLSTEDAVKATR